MAQAAIRAERQDQMSEEAIVYVVDDDPSVRDAIDSLLRSVGLKVLAFGSVEEFHSAPKADAPGCLILDIRMPGQSGLDFQRDLVETGSTLPIIFISGHGDIPMSVRAMKAGAIEFLTKPFRDQDLLDAIQSGLERDRARRNQSEMLVALRTRFDGLTGREQQIMRSVISGLLNKQIAAQIGLSEITVKVCRGQIMRKMEATSLADLVRMADKLGIPSDKT